MARRAIVMSLAAASFGLVAPRAGGATPDERERAIALFIAGRDLMAKGDFVAACPKFAESEALDDQIGTLMNLAFCDEHVDRTATAWWSWIRAAKEADARGQPKRAVFARDNANRLQPTLLRVSVRLPPSMMAVPVLVTIDGLELTELGNPAPVDPGEHELRAEVPGRIPWSTRFAATSEGVPPLFVPDLAGPEPERGASNLSGDLTVASRANPRPSGPPPTTWILGGIGGAAMALGAGFGIAAVVNENASNSNRKCLGNGNCVQAGVDDRANARRDALIADVSFAIGAGVLLTAAVLWATGAQRSHAPVRAKVELAATRDAWSIDVSRAW